MHRHVETCNLSAEIGRYKMVSFKLSHSSSVSVLIFGA